MTTDPTGHATPELVAGEYDEAAAQHDALVRALEQARVENARLRERAAAATEARQQLAGAVERYGRLLATLAYRGGPSHRITTQIDMWASDLLALAASAPPAAPSEATPVTIVPKHGRYRIPGLEGVWRNMGLETVGLGEDGRAVLRMYRVDPAPDQGMVREASATPRCGHRSGIHDEYCDVINDPGPDPGGEEHDEALSGEPPAGDWVSAEVYWVTTESLRAERDALADLRSQVVMALCAEDDDEERTDAEIVQRVRELTLAATDESLELDRLRTAGDEHLQALRGKVDDQRVALDLARQHIIEARAEIEYRKASEADAWQEARKQQTYADEARQEAERLRGGLDKIADWCEDMAENAANPHAAIGDAALRLRALASTGGSDTTGADHG